MRKLHITNVLSDAEAERWRKKRLEYSDAPILDVHVIRNQSFTVTYGPDRKLLLVFLKDVLDKKLCEDMWHVLRQVKAEPSNRPEIIGEGARQHRIRKTDNLLSPRVAVAPNVLAEFKGKADMLGYYRYKNSAAGIPDCDRTGWMRSQPDIYKAALPLIIDVDDLYRLSLPHEYATQAEYVKQIDSRWKVPGTVFTTLYVLKNAPTAVHTDKFDLPSGFGVMATLGDFRGSEICFPKFRIAVDYQPGDLLLADVHQLHGNFPLYDDGGERVCCVFFVRKGQHECPATGGKR